MNRRIASKVQNSPERYNAYCATQRFCRRMRRSGTWPTAARFHARLRELGLLPPDTTETP